MTFRLRLLQVVSVIGLAAAAPTYVWAQEPEAAKAVPAAAAIAAEAAPAQRQEPSVGTLLAERVRSLRTVAGRDRDERTALAAFYAKGASLWLDGDRFSARAQAVVAELGKADDWGLAAKDYAIPSAPAGREAALDAEIALSLSVLKYARDARGGRIDPLQLSNNLDRQPQLVEPGRVLQSIAEASAPDDYLRKLHPQHPQFERLRQLYLSMRAGTFQVSAPAAEPAVAAEPETKGKKGKQKAKRQAQPPETPTAAKVLHNMEMWRWMPERLGDFYVTVNVPEFTLRVMKDGEAVHTERVIAGLVTNQTPMFSDEMETVVFHPGWGVPNSIKVKELLPGLLRGQDTLARNGLRASYRGREVSAGSIDWARTDIRQLDIIQPPGGSNVLGQLKFLFPNKHDVYMHDTPTKNLFNADVRTFSHGCMRVRNPVRLAEVILAHDQGWTADRVASTLRSGGQNNNVSLKTKIPVHITYFTVTVDQAGKPSFFKDFYGHEKLIQMGLDGKAHLIVKKKDDLNVARAEVIGRLADGRPSYQNKDWFSQLFGGF